MKSIATSAIWSVAALSSCAFAAVPINIAKNPAPGLKLSKRMLAARKDFSASLENEVNQITDSNYIINVQVGTPAQDIKLAIDTGSSDVWVLDSNSTACSSSFATSSECETPCEYHLMILLQGEIANGRQLPLQALLPSRWLTDRKSVV